MPLLLHRGIQVDGKSGKRGERVWIGRRRRIVCRVGAEDWIVAMENQRVSLWTMNRDERDNDSVSGCSMLTRFVISKMNQAERGEKRQGNRRLTE